MVLSRCIVLVVAPAPPARQEGHGAKTPQANHSRSGKAPPQHRAARRREQGWDATLNRGKLRKWHRKRQGVKAIEGNFGEKVMSPATTKRQHKRPKARCCRAEVPANGGSKEEIKCVQVSRPAEVAGSEEGKETTGEHVSTGGQIWQAQGEPSLPEGRAAHCSSVLFFPIAGPLSSIYRDPARSFAEKCFQKAAA
ncbi:hypothetical protein ERJ75_001628300 [Trypanosoma vivax]|nr:hypothetical protein ERJ75_001628300 [Trypanosoma vivax]